MSTIKSSTEHLTLNADGAGKEIKFQANGVEVASIDSTGALTVAGLTSTGIDDNATSTAITIDSSENVGIGTTPQGTPYSTSKQMFIGATGVVQTFDTSDYESIYLAENTRWDVSGTQHSIISGEASNIRLYRGKMEFGVHGSVSADTAQSSWNTAMTINNNSDINFGNFNSAGGSTGVEFGVGGGSSAPEISSSCNGTPDRVHYSFHNNNGQVGRIMTSGTATSYYTSSDYRLKENVVPMTGSIDRLKALKPSRFNFIADADKTVDGFLAHEAGEVVPEAIGETPKDAMKDEEYEVTPAVMDGETVVTEAVMGTRSVPDYQGIDQSKLVPLLVASLQEAVAKIESLEARVTALEV